MLLEELTQRYKIREAAKQTYSKFLAEQHCYDIASKIAGHGTPKFVGEGAPKITSSRLKGYIIVGLSIWIMYLSWY
jgi:hypothetical protein